jgi:hypothetical protein
MTRASRNALLLALLAAGVAIGTGCAGSGCTLTPDVGHAPSSCALAPDTSVTVSVLWCTCSATTVCNVTDEGGGAFQLEPMVNASCDGSCEPNPASCPTDNVQCNFTTPGAGTYHLYIISGQGSVDVPMYVSDGGGASCS